MFVLAGVRFVLMTELHKIKGMIDVLLDRYGQTSDPNTKALLKTQLEKKRRELEEWHRIHGYS